MGWVRLVFIKGCLVWPLGLLISHKRLYSVSVALSSLSAAQMLPSAPIKRMLCACIRLSQSLNSSGFPADHPIGSFWPSKITFGVDYMLSVASPNYSSALRWSPTAAETARGAIVRDASMVTKKTQTQQNSQLRVFFPPTSRGNEQWYIAEHLFWIYYLHQNLEDPRTQLGKIHFYKSLVTFSFFLTAVSSKWQNITRTCSIQSHLQMFLTARNRSGQHRHNY